MRLCRMQLGKHSFMPNAAAQQREVLLHPAAGLAWAASESHHTIPVGFIGFWNGLQNTQLYLPSEWLAHNVRQALLRIQSRCKRHSGRRVQVTRHGGR